MRRTDDTPKVTITMHSDGLYVLLSWYAAKQDSGVPVTPQDRAIHMLLADLLAEEQEAKRGKK